ncbi:hypothetical protein ACO0SA_002089 [Hanseniaspora valbyensis]
MSVVMLDAKSIYALMTESLNQHKYFNNSKNVNGILMISKTGSLLMSKFNNRQTINNNNNNTGSNASVLNFISLLIASNYSQEEIVVEKLSDGNLIGIQSYEINLDLTNNGNSHETNNNDEDNNGNGDNDDDESSDLNQQLYNMCCCNIPNSDLILVYLSKIDQLELGALKIIISNDIQLYKDLYGYKE